MKKISVILLALIFVMGTLTACGGSGGGADADTINVGVNYELSGDVASYGTDSKDGIEMAINEINENGGVLGGKKINLIIKDNKSDPAEATSVAEALFTSKDNVVAALGPATSGNFRATIQPAMNNQVPIISSSATADEDITVDKNGNTREFVFRTCFTDSFQGKTMAAFAKNNLNATKAVIYADNSSDYAKGLAANFKEMFTQLGGTIVAEEGYMAKDKDFNAVLTSIKSKEFDVLYIPGYYQEVGLIIKQARELGIDAPILGGDGFDSPDLVELAGKDAANDIFFSNHYSSLDQDPKVQDFIKKHNELKGKDPGAFVAMGYDLGMYIADALERAGEPDPIKLAQALSSTKEFSGITGTFSVGEDHNVIKDAVVIEMQGGEQVRAEKISIN